MEIFEWITWIIFAVCTLVSFVTWKIKKRAYQNGTLYDSREVVARKTIPRFVIVNSTLLIIFLFIDISKFHLIWIYPGVYLIIMLRMSRRVVKEDDERNKRSFEDILRKAQNGDVNAQFKLSKIYLYKEDDKNAIEWTQRAAAQGHPDAQHALSVAYSGGVVMTQDLVQALMWCTLSANQGHKEAIVDRDLIVKNMNPGQIERAESLAREWKLKNRN
jgi:hypothetical protein